MLLPAGRYRVATPPCDLNLEAEVATDAGVPLPCAVHILGEGEGQTELVWEAAGWQLLAAEAGGQQWQRAAHSTFPFALATHGLVLALITFTDQPATDTTLAPASTAPAPAAAAAPAAPAAARGSGAAAAATPTHRRRSCNNPFESPRSDDAAERNHRLERLDPPSALDPTPVRYDVRLQSARLCGFRVRDFDPPLAAAFSVDGASERCQLWRAKQRDQHRSPQNLKRGCAACTHAAKAKGARELLRAYDGWLTGGDATREGDLLGAAAAFERAAVAATEAGEDVEAGLLWSNRAECLLRLSDYGPARATLQKALQHWPEHGDSHRRLAFIDLAEEEPEEDTAERTTLGCCEIDVNFFGFERTGAKALGQLAGDLYGAAAELEAALSLGGGGGTQAVWLHADLWSPREIRMGGGCALNVSIPNGFGAGSHSSDTIFQEVDLVCADRSLWCEVKAYTTLVTDEEAAAADSDHSERMTGGVSRWEALLAQLLRYREASASFARTNALLEAPVVAAVVQGPRGASDAAVAALRKEGFGCLSLPDCGGSAVGITAALRLLPQNRNAGAAPAGSELSAGAGSRRNGSSDCLEWAKGELFGHSPSRPDVSLPAATAASAREEINQAPGCSTPSTLDPSTDGRTVLNLDQGMLAVLVANIWELTVDDMRESGAKFLRLYSGETVFETPEGLLATLRPLHRFLTSPNVRLVACESSVSSFEHFLNLRGDPIEMARWAELRESDRL